MKDKLIAPRPVYRDKLLALSALGLGGLFATISVIGQSISQGFYNIRIQGVVMPALMGVTAGAIIAFLVLRNRRLLTDQLDLERALSEELSRQVDERTSELAVAKMAAEIEARYRSLVDLSPDGLMVDVDDEIVFCNSTMATILGAESPQQIVGRSAIALIPLEHRAAVQESIDQATSGEVQRSREATYQRLDGTRIDVERSIAVITWQQRTPAFLVLSRDISERKRREVQTRQARKMDSLGTLAGGVAHELNNMLMPIQGLTELTMNEVPEDSRARGNLAIVLKSAKRAAELVNKILSFSHQDEAVRKPVDLRDGPDCNLLGLEPDTYAKLSVKDTGHGMDEATIGRIFEPFFTTKGVGEGTGMGLAMIHGIVTSYGGAIDVSSEPGAGTTFDIYLPLAGASKPALAANGRHTLSSDALQTF